MASLLRSKEARRTATKGRPMLMWSMYVCSTCRVLRRIASLSRNIDEIDTSGKCAPAGEVYFKENI